MEKSRKTYEKPHTISLPIQCGAHLCAGSGTKGFLNEDGTKGFMDATVEENGNAAEAASRMFNDEDCSEDN